MTRCWLYKHNTQGGPAGYWGKRASDVLAKDVQHQWGGSYASLSAQVWPLLGSEVAKGDVVVAHLTDDQAVIGFCVVTKVTGPPGDRKLYLRSIECLAQPFKIRQHKPGISLESSWTARPMMLGELTRQEMFDHLSLAGAPQRVLRGLPRKAGYTP
jgi:hypothetical protein